MWGIILLAALAAEPKPVTVCLTQLWEVYDYDYEHQDENGSYAELVTWAWTVEIKHDLPGGMTGWKYIGFIRLTRILWYDSNEEDTEAWWRSQTGKTGTEATTEDAARQILKHSGRHGEIEIRWR